ncbi:hypothetical protein ANAPC2_01415 [Anaplasma phagocytophilum]|nr:hypothetical protein ANAPC2_01415 [Anaplasma phagocytophilum]
MIPDSKSSSTAASIAFRLARLTGRGLDFQARASPVSMRCCTCLVQPGCSVNISSKLCSKAANLSRSGRDSPLALANGWPIASQCATELGVGWLMASSRSVLSCSVAFPSAAAMVPVELSRKLERGACAPSRYPPLATSMMMPVLARKSRPRMMGTVSPAKWTNRCLCAR